MRMTAVETASVTKMRGCAKTRGVVTVQVNESSTATIHRLRGMFLEVPGTRLSVPDASRLAGVDLSACRQVLEALADAHFLKRGRDGTFTLA